jgi:hypothetical protein
MARTDDDVTRAAHDAVLYVQHLRASGTRKRRVNRAADGVALWLEWCATVDLEANPLDMTDLLGRFSDVKPRWAVVEAADWMVWRIDGSSRARSD